MSYTAERAHNPNMGLFTLLGILIGVGAGGATYTIAKKKKVGTGGSAAAGVAIGAAAWWAWPVQFSISV